MRNFLVLLSIVAVFSCSKDNSSPPSTAAEITEFSFKTPDATGIISEGTINITVPEGTNVTNLVATFVTTGASVKVGEAEQLRIILQTQ